MRSLGIISLHYNRYNVSVVMYINISDVSAFQLKIPFPLLVLDVGFMSCFEKSYDFTPRTQEYHHELNSRWMCG